jgi:predicted nuclease of predicted toxin-antitoxin system
MKILCDVHISNKFVAFLNEKGIEAIHINNILDKWYSKDSDICRFADINGFTVCSKDSDFKNSFFLQNTPRRLIRITNGNISNTELITIFEKNLNLIIKYSKKDSFYIEIGKSNISVTSY